MVQDQKKVHIKLKVQTKVKENKQDKHVQRLKSKGEKMLEQVPNKQLYKINKNQYLKINKKGNGEIIAPIKDPVTKEFNWNNLIFTGGTIWGTIKVILIVLFLIFLLWRYNVEVSDCLVIRANYNPETGCINREYFGEQINLKEVDNAGLGINISSFAEGNDRSLS